MNETCVFWKIQKLTVIYYQFEPEVTPHQTHTIKKKNGRKARLFCLAERVSAHSKTPIVRSGSVIAHV